MAVFDVLKEVSVPSLTIKWPNDILSGNQKICGILVETTFTQQKIKNAVIGIGLNVNQQKFPDFIKNVSSLKNLLQRDFNLDEILQKLAKKIQSRIIQLENREFEKNLSRIPSTFV